MELGDWCIMLKEQMHQISPQDGILENHEQARLALRSVVQGFLVHGPMTSFAKAEAGELLLYDAVAVLDLGERTMALRQFLKLFEHNESCRQFDVSKEALQNKDAQAHDQVWVGNRVLQRLNELIHWELEVDDLRGG